MAVVFGVGVGLFVLGVIWGLSILMCVVLSRSTGNLQMGGIGVIILAGIITIILVLFPKEPLEPLPSEVKITDNTFISRVLMLTLLGLFTLISLVCMFLFHWMEPIFAQPIKAKRF